MLSMLRLVPKLEYYSRSANTPLDSSVLYATDVIKNGSINWMPGWVADDGKNGHLSTGLEISLQGGTRNRLERRAAEQKIPLLQ